MKRWIIEGWKGWLLDDTTPYPFPVSMGEHPHGFGWKHKAQAIDECQRLNREESKYFGGYVTKELQRRANKYRYRVRKREVGW